MPPPPPPDDPMQMHMNHQIVPPPVILVPHPIIVPIIIPIPMPLSAFWNAYQVGKKPNEPETPSTENDNESHHEEAPEKVEENEQPLDYTTTKSPDTNDNNFPLHNDNENENGIDSIRSDRIENSSNGNNSEKIPKFKITRLNMKRGTDKDFENESCRPLRKRRIIAEVDNLSESS